jgi:hypothetical protein
MARRHSTSRRSRAAAAAAFVLAAALAAASTPAAAAARVLRAAAGTPAPAPAAGSRGGGGGGGYFGVSGSKPHELAASSSSSSSSSSSRVASSAAANPPPAALHDSHGSLHSILPDMGPTGDLLRGPGAKLQGGGGSTSVRGAGGAAPPLPPGPAGGSPPARGSYSLISTSLAEAEARRDGSGFEGYEPEHVARAGAGYVRMSRAQADVRPNAPFNSPAGVQYTGTGMANVVGGRMAAMAITQLGARAQSISGGRPIVSRYGTTPQATQSRIMSGFSLPAYPVAVAGSARTHGVAISGDGGTTGVIASTPLAQSIAKAG